MNQDELRDLIIENMRRENKSNFQLLEHNSLLMYLHSLMPFTGRLDILYCNNFLNEAIQLLVNSIFLFEDGFFDCAFYSIRQSKEIIDSMLYLSNSSNKALESWSNKEYIEMKKVKQQLEKLSDGYKEIKTLIPDYFNHLEVLIKKSHKIIHKQGFDTFYNLRTIKEYNFSQQDEIEFFLQCLKYTIGFVLIIFIIIDPISLALADEEVTLKLNFNFLTDPIDIGYFKKYLGLDNIIEKIKISNFYKDFISFFNDKETMSPAVYSVIREEFWDIDALNEIEKQLDLLNRNERFMFSILKCGIKVSNFYFDRGLIWYFTSIKSKFRGYHYSKEEFDKYLENENKFNQKRGCVFISVITAYDEPIYLEHNEPLTNDETVLLLIIEALAIQ